MKAIACKQALHDTEADHNPRSGRAMLLRFNTQCLTRTVAVNLLFLAVPHCAHLFVSKCACLWTSALTSLHPVAPCDNLRPFLHHGCSVEISEGTPPRHGDNAPILWVHDMLHIHRSVTVTMRSAMGSCNVWDDVLRIFSHSGIRLKISVSQR